MKRFMRTIVFDKIMDFTTSNIATDGEVHYVDVNFSAYII